MKESLNNFLTYCCTGLVGLAVVIPTPPQSRRAALTEQIQSTPTVQEQIIPAPQQNLIQAKPQRILRLSITVDHPSFLKIKQGEEINVGQVISDNTVERLRLTKQLKSIKLHVENLKSKVIHPPFEPKKPVPSKPLPKAIFSEEETAISMAQLRLTQAQLILETRTELLKTENPEKRSEVEKAEAALDSIDRKVEEQEQLIKSMKDMKLQSQILEHEEALLKQLTSDQEQGKSDVKRAKAKLDASVIEQQQQLQQLQLAVRIARKELEVASSRLTASQNRRQLLEYDASIEQTKRSQQENLARLEYSRQMQQYETAQRDRDYQVAQLNISLSSIEDKLSQIPVVRSPRNGYIRRIKPWVGNNGKYTTTVIISSTPPNSSSSYSQNQTNTDSTNTTPGSKQSKSSITSTDTRSAKRW